MSVRWSCDHTGSRVTHSLVEYMERFKVIRERNESEFAGCEVTGIDSDGRKRT